VKTVTAARYLTLLAAGIVACMSAVVFANWLVNPFSLFEPPEIRGINRNKPGYVDHLRLTHVYRVNRLEPDCVLLGTSRTGRGLRPDHPALSGWDCYNLALPAISLYEMRRHLQHAQSVRPQKLAVLSLDFRVFNSRPDTSGAFVEQRLDVDPGGQPQSNLFSSRLPDMASSLASASALLASMTSVRKQSWVKDTLDAKGFWLPLTDEYDHAPAFRSYTRNTARRYAAASRDEAAYLDNIGQFRALVREAHARKTELKIIVPPSHAWHWQTLWFSGLWPRFEDMKRTIVALNEEEARRAGRAPYPVWDFSGATGPALEPVPEAPGPRMQWFWEPVHFKRALGDAMLDAVMGGAPPSTPDLAGFGARIDSSSIDRHLERLRAAQSAYELRNPVAIDRIRRLMAEASSGSGE